MSKHYHNGYLVSIDNILPRKNNMHYRDQQNGVYEVYSYYTLIGYIVPKERKFLEWASIVHYSITTSKQATTLFYQLRAMGVVDTRIAIDEHMASLYVEKYQNERK